MICPNKICKKEIPNDSIFCDQCGVHLRQCSKCGSITLAKFCVECGGMVTDRKFNKPQVAQPAQEQDAAQKEEAEGTKIIEATPQLEIVHSAFTLNISSGDVLGRTTGPHSASLGQFPVISSKHAKVELLGGEWFVTDLHSTNKSYLNGKALTPDSPAKLRDEDTLVLANIPFKVAIK